MVKLWRTPTLTMKLFVVPQTVLVLGHGTPLDVLQHPDVAYTNNPILSHCLLHFVQGVVS